MDLTEFEAKYLAHLNAQQQAAVRAVDGPVLLLATPGSGKTTVLVTRIGYMVHCRGIDPRSILTMTYTVAATRDMKSRYAACFGEETAAKLQFRTINSISKSIIDYFARHHAGREPYTLQTDEAELNRLVRAIYQELNNEYPEDSEIREIRRLITYIKNMMLPDEEIEKLKTEVEKLPEIYKRYQDALRSLRLMDFDDQMGYAYTLLQRFPALLNHFQEQYRYLCVDEAQDTSKIQHEIIKLLAAKYENLFMVGDEDQSIYGFRAAYPEALLQFEQDHPNAKVLLMEENYRSSDEIVAAANRFVAQNRFRHEKSIVPTRGSVAPVHVVYAKDRATQYQYLLGMATRVSAETAILFRNNDTALPLIDLLEQHGVPYRARNVDDLFFTHRIVTDILDILRFAYDPLNEELFLRLYYKFSAPISRKAAQYAITKSRASRKPLVEELMHAPDIRGSAQDTVIDLMQNLPLLPHDRAETAIHRIWQAMHYGRYVEQKKLDQGKYFILCQLARGVESPEAFLHKLAALRETMAAHENSPEAKLILSTIHSSKGLEYDTVYLADIIDGVLPSLTAADVENIDDARLYEEERRLYYVGMTRAKNDLYLFSCGESSEFTAEMLRTLPVPVPAADDVFSPLLRSRIGKQYADRRFGSGVIVAACLEESLVAFPDGHTELMSLAEMFSRRSTAIAYEAPSVKTSAPVDAVYADDQLLSRLQVGTSIRHKTFGSGRILSIENDVMTVAFAAKGIRRLGLSMSVQNHIISLY